MKTRLLKFLSPFLAVTLLAGCAGYHLGPVNNEIAGAKSIQIRPFNNRALQPRLGDAVTQALRERLQADGTYSIATSKAGDIIVSGDIVSDSRDSLSYLPGDVVTAANYHITIVAHVVARDSDTGKVLLDKNVTGSTLVQVGSDLASSERQATPLLADDLARKITQLLTEGAW